MTTNRYIEQVVWQRQAIAVLDTLLAQSVKDELPRLLWTIGNAGVSLVGRSNAYPSTDRLSEIQVWADFLDIQVRQHHHRDGMITLSAHAKQKHFGNLWATITLTCDIYPSD